MRAHPFGKCSRGMLLLLFLAAALTGAYFPVRFYSAVTADRSMPPDTPPAYPGSTPSAEIPWHALTFHCPGGGTNGDSLISIFDDMELRPTQVDSRYPHPFPVREDHSEYYDPVTITRHVTGIHLERNDPALVGCATYWFNYPVDTIGNKWTVMIHVLKWKEALPFHPAGHVSSLYKNTLIDSLHYANGSFIQYEQRYLYGNYNYIALWKTGPWYIRLIIFRVDHEQRDIGLLLLTGMTDRMFGYFRDLNRRYAEDVR